MSRADDAELLGRIAAGAQDERRQPRLLNLAARLPARWRAALALRHVHELTHREVAQVLGVSLRTAKQWSRQGLERLREELTRREERS